MRLTHTGCSGVTASIHSRRGSSAPGKDSWSQLPPRIQAPLGSSRALAAIRAVNSAGLAASRSWTPSRVSPPSMKWTWLSMKPGSTRRPSRSITRVPVPTQDCSSPAEPTARIRSPVTAAAPAQGRSGSTV
jgi:hypothetical protein